MTEKQDHYEANRLFEHINTNKKPILYLCKSDKDARLINQELSLYLNDSEIGYYPEREILPYDRFSTPQFIVQERIKLLNSTKKQYRIVVTSILNVFEKLPAKSFFDSKKNINTGDIISMNEVIKSLLDLGYEKKDKVESINQYAIRGGVIDIYSGFYSYPIRVDFFGDQIDEIRYFDVNSQTMTEKIHSFQLSHGSEIALDEISINSFKDNWRNYFQEYDERYCELFQSISKGMLVDGYEIYMPFLQENPSNLIEYFKDFKILHTSEISKSINQFNVFINERYEEEAIDSQRPILKPNDYYYSNNSIKEFLRKSKELTKTKSINYINSSLDLNQLIELMIEKYNQGEIKTILITSTEQAKLDNLKIISNFKNTSLPFIKTNGLFKCLHKSSRFYLNKTDNFFYINIDNYEGQENIFDTKISRTKESLVSSFVNPFQNEEFVIHQNYGIGIYKGLVLLKTNLNEEEFIQIEYLNNELLYVPIRQAYLLSKYQTSLINDIRLDSLSSTKWKIKKHKAEKKAKDHAAELLDIESRRSIATTEQLIAPKESYDKFCNDFPYIPTNDQLNCINDILKDLSLIKPMNRVICGDVGFGKTEIAMRASFVCVQSNKQVMILAPSTILSKQHLETFIKRFINFPFNIELLTRHTSQKKRKKIVCDFRENKIDILIGTHALLTDELDLQNVGLLVIDEEHRFGTKQKEIIKSRQVNLHILYMSATPIPRTLNLVYSGLKDFSYLYTPPKERLSVKTFLNVQNNQIIKNALEREITRGGQVFLVQNDISKMSYLKDSINKLLPNIKIDFAHGRLNKTAISKTMSAFNSNQLDILICTTIVEMGLDIPNANTIIVLDSQNFGLSQLHQLRGRVGRSIRQAYCYFLIPSFDIKRNPKEKLESLVKYSELGSGYFIAQEDLEIRGAGDFLGIKQSGHIEAIGLTMYLSMLKDAINNLKGVPITQKNDCDINFNDRALIPESYMPVANERLKYYRSLNDAPNEKEINKILTELKDRCGKPGQEVINLINNTKLKLLANKIGIKKIYYNKDNIIMTLKKSLNNQMHNKLIGMIESKNSHLKLINEMKLNFNVTNKSNKRNALSMLLHEVI